MIDGIEDQIANYIIQNKDNFYRLAFSYVRNPEDALDIVQESIYKAFSSKNHIRSPEKIKTWFYRIIVNTSLDFLRKAKRLTLLNDEVIDRLDTGEADIYENFDLKIAMRKLPEPYHSIITMRFFEDLTIKEIASILKCNLSTVKSRLYEGLRKLRLIINDEYLEEGLE